MPPQSAALLCGNVQFTFIKWPTKDTHQRSAVYAGDIRLLSLINPVHHDLLSNTVAVFSAFNVLNEIWCKRCCIIICEMWKAAEFQFQNVRSVSKLVSFVNHGTLSSSFKSRCSLKAPFGQDNLHLYHSYEYMKFGSIMSFPGNLCPALTWAQV